MCDRYLVTLWRAGKGARTISRWLRQIPLTPRQLAGSTAIYAFSAPMTGAQVPVIGGLGGFGDTFPGAVHRLQLFRGDAQGADI